MVNLSLGITFDFFQMDLEIPCRDTDDINTDNMAVKGETLAFTIDFGGSDNSSEKAKKFERFAQRSSQRRVCSPRQGNKKEEETKREELKQSDDHKQRTIVLNREKSNMARVIRTNDNSKNNVQNVQRTMDDMHVQDLEMDKEFEKDEAQSSTGTYTMDDDEELKKVNKIYKGFEIMLNQ